MPTCYGIEALKLSSAFWDFGEHIIVICGHLLSIVVPKNAEITSSIKQQHLAYFGRYQSAKARKSFSAMPLAASAVVPWNNQCSLTTSASKKHTASSQRDTCQCLHLHSIEPKLKVKNTEEYVASHPMAVRDYFGLCSFLTFVLWVSISSHFSLALSYFLSIVLYKFTAGSSGGKADKPPLLMASMQSTATLFTPQKFASPALWRWRNLEQCVHVCFYRQFYRCLNSTVVKQHLEERSDHSQIHSKLYRFSLDNQQPLFLFPMTCS